MTLVIAINFIIFKIYSAKKFLFCKNKMTGRIKNISEKIKSSPLISGNSPNVNAILLLLFAAYFIVGADLSKEIARERGEFKFFQGILTESNPIDSFEYLDFLIAAQPVIGEVGLVHFIPPKNDVTELYSGRAPPENPPD